MKIEILAGNILDTAADVLISTANRSQFLGY